MFFYEDDALLFEESFCDEDYRRELLISSPDDALLLLTGAHDLECVQACRDIKAKGYTVCLNLACAEVLTMAEYESICDLVVYSKHKSFGPEATPLSLEPHAAISSTLQTLTVPLVLTSPRGSSRS